MSRVKTVILGIYAGRSGSKSLAMFLSQQPDMNVSWEQSGFVDIPSLCNPVARLTRFLRQPEQFVGDLDYHWIWHLGSVWHLQTHKIIYLYRDANEIADSFWSYLKKQPYGDILPSETHVLASWPFLGLEGSRDDIYRTVRQYQAEVEIMAFRHPGRMIRIEIDDLNNLDFMMQLLDLLGYPKEGRVEKLHNIRSFALKGIPQDVQYIDISKTKPWEKKN